MLTGNEQEQLKREYYSKNTLIRLPPGKFLESLEFITAEKEKWAKRFHPLVLINGEPKIGEGTKIGIISEVYDKAGIVSIGAGCDIGSFVAINCADSSAKATHRDSSIRCRPITIDES